MATTAAPETPVPAAPAIATPSPEVAAATSAAPVPLPVTVEPAPAAAAPEAKIPESTPSLLAAADAGKREGAPKPADTPPPDGANKAEPAPQAEKPAEEVKAKPEGEPAAAPDEALAEKPPALPTYDAFKVPEGQKLSDKELGQFTELLGKFETETKLDHGKAQEFGQRMIDFYLADVQRIGTEIQQRLETNQREVWARYNETEIGQLKADPEIGGTRLDEKLGNAKYVIEQFLPKADQERLLTKFDNGGVANSVELIRMLNNIYERYREPNSVAPNPPAATSTNRSEPGQRGWYRNVDGQAA
jgi:hypothetical protein